MRKSVYTSIAAGVVVATGLTIMAPSISDDCASQVQTSESDLLELSAQCEMSVSHVEWIDWIMGKSISYQFHYLDLLELLYSFGSSRSEPVNTSGN